MNRLREHEFRRVYGPTRGHDALREFLVPALSCAVTYDRVAGYFSSSSIAYTAPGLSRLVRRGGRVRIVTSHHLVSQDLHSLQSTVKEFSKVDQIAKEFEQAVHSPGASLEAQMRSDYLKAMFWLLREGQLEIKFVVPVAENSSDLAKFHSKFGIITDEFGDQIVFSGSTNETALGWSGNLENIDTKPLWIEGFEDFSEYKQTFEDLWEGRDLCGWETISLPDALSLRLVRLAPEGEFPDIDKWTQTGPEVEFEVPVRKPRGYQLSAVQHWVAAGHRGILEMATGTGKTLTARLCIEEAAKLGSLCVLLVTPYQHISDQWAAELRSMECYQVGTDGEWRKKLQQLMLDSEIGIRNRQVVIAVKNTASSEDFVALTSRLAANFDNFLFIGDEVHWLGATTFQAALNDKASMRLGLSATPKRYFDPDGTAALDTYFAPGVVYKFGLQEALNWRNPETAEVGVLTPYEYHPLFVQLAQDEIASWSEVTQKIQAILSKENRSLDDQRRLESLLNTRADIAKTAEAKIPALESLLLELGPQLRQALIYSASHEQMEDAMKVARLSGIDTGARITAAEGAAPSAKFAGVSERQHILDRFARGVHSVIFAIAALDEGVDIPTAEIGIILASSGNEKEFIQRRGRLMRKSPGKKLARIYDFIVLPPEDKFESLRTKELKRALEFAELATNSVEVSGRLKERLGTLDEQ
jgi:superfamily II DNA or RNA helicase